MEKFRNKYRIESARAQWWDYGSDGAYFITICTQNRECFFGEITNGEIYLSPLGDIAKRCWCEIPQQFPYAKLGDFVIMPNHIHGILMIDKSNGCHDCRDSNGFNDFNDSNGCHGSNGFHGHGHVETRLIASLPTSTSIPTPIPTSTPIPTPIPMPQSVGGFAGNKNPMINENIPRTIRWYKGRCSFEIQKMNVDFAWQPRFHDHIIRNDQEYQRISDYILNNPVNWQNDKFYEP